MMGTASRRVATAALIGAMATALLTVPVSASTERMDATAAFAAAAEEFDVPRDLVVAIGQAESRLDMHGGKPSQDNGFGVMHLVSNPSRHTLEQAAAATGASTSALKNDVTTNIRGGAAVLRALADAQGLTDTDRGRVDAWYPVVVSYGGAKVPQTQRLYADAVYDLLTKGLAAVAPTGERITVAPREVTPDRGKLAAGAGALDYPGAIWNPASTANYASGRTASISTVVIHVTQGSYAGTISWFQNPDAQVSAHYVVRSSDGEVTQMVADGDTAWHARSANASSLGIEHEGFVDDPAWFTDAMYRASAAVTKWLCDNYGLAKSRDVIVGHSEVPGNDHTDPGPNWDWDYYMSLVTA